MADQNHTCAACLQLQGELAQAAMDHPATQTCAFGLCETVVPVKLGSQTIGLLQTGQVFRLPPNEASFRRAFKQGQKLGGDMSNPATKTAYFATPVVARRKLDAVSNMLAVFADHLAMSSNQFMVQVVNAELPVITKARQFISEHYTENLSLTQVACAMNISSFYFCKQFRKVTGLSFTEFVSRTRIEKAKNFLLNDNLRISEIAFTVGFQSLTQFNRAFKKIVGQSPTRYRDQLPVTA